MFKIQSFIIGKCYIRPRMGMVIKNNHILPMMECVGMQMSQKEFEQKTKKQKVLRNEIERVFSKLPTTDIGRHTQEKIVQRPTTKSWYGAS